ncbi:polysaccharide deacetylase family protein [Rufibacter sediminis]|uniref:Polysaccharide deacetylase family protein n=1 Tax=Rufibacter sediminis TaxID=2762756 RepID=A0ABR6VYM2_9BACT|nr:polysaccharide deacetylase family protein [Rufibacter sediminis]MBC3542305.1 polysaccharide deacetylase family protein [Rufibacter sediminis]
MRFHKTPPVLPWLFRKAWWKRPVSDKILFLTFDDGPIPEVTPFVLEQLAQYNAKATFFCVGENLERYPDLAREAKAQGHQLANHTHQHVKAWKVSPAEYRQQVERCQAALEKVGSGADGPKFFRPPHGQLTWRHLRMLEPEYQVVMWSTLTYDFDASLYPEECLAKAIAVTKPGSVVVLHDSLKAERNLRYVLPRLLRHFSDLGYVFKTL